MMSVKGRLVLFLLLPYIFTSVKKTSAQSDCEFYYSEQPPASLSCDPYQQRLLKMECTVHGPLHADFDLVWFSVALGPGGTDIVRLQEIVGGHDPSPSMMQNSSNVTIRSQLHQDGAVKRIRSRLELQLSREASTYDTAFWCSVLARPNTTEDGTPDPAPIPLPSEAFILRVADVYTDLPVCSSTPQSSERHKCASPFLPPAATTPSNASSTILTTPTQTFSIAHSTNSHKPSILPSSSQDMVPTVVPSNPPPEEDLNEGQNGLNAIVFPILGVLTGAFSTLSLVACLYLWCHNRQKKRHGGVAHKRTVEATYHTYSSPGTLSSYQPKGGLHRIGRGESLAFCPSSSSSVPVSQQRAPRQQRARGHRLEGSQETTCSQEQYVEMSGVHRAASHSSCPTLQRTSGVPVSLSECGSMKLGFSYEVPVPFHLEPEYASIPTPYVPYLVPVPVSMESGLNRNSRLHRQQSTRSHREVYIGTATAVPQLRNPSSMSAPASPISHHDYEELIHTTTNEAYRELNMGGADDRDSGCYTALVPLPQPNYTILHNCTEDK